MKNKYDISVALLSQNFGDQFFELSIAVAVIQTKELEYWSGFVNMGVFQQFVL
jgi:hypothetical protein